MTPALPVEFTKQTVSLPFEFVIKPRRQETERLVPASSTVTDSKSN